MALSPETKAKISESMKRAYKTGRHPVIGQKKAPTRSGGLIDGLISGLDFKIKELTALRESLAKYRGEL